MPSGVYKRTPEMNAAMSETLKNSEAAKAKSEAQRGITLSPEHCRAISKAKLGIPFTPEHCAAISAAKLGVLRSPEACVAIVRGRKESGTNDAMRGENDIVGHHYIYDHADLSNNIIKMTRSMHMKLHQLFRKYGIEIPHINIKVK